MIYAGIGSREMSKYPKIMELTSHLGSVFALRGWILRSGNAKGADRAFEAGADRVISSTEPWDPLLKEIFLDKDADYRTDALVRPLVKRFDNRTPGARKLLSRNALQVLGKHLADPVDIVICWTDDGTTKGGTRVAVKLAQERNIPVVNFGNMKDPDLKSVLQRIDYELST